MSPNRSAAAVRIAFLGLGLVACSEDRPPAPAPAPAATPAPAPGPRPRPPERPPPPAIADPVEGLLPPRPRDAQFRRGVSLGLFVSTEDPEWRATLYRDFLDEIAELGATDIQLVVSWAQRDVAATEIHPEPGITVDDDVVAFVIDEAHARDLRVFLMPTLRLLHRPRGEWRGKLAPADWDAWWQSYRAFTLHYAGIARRGRVDLFSVGSELVTTESQGERWRALIADVRKRFRGGLTYSANWDHFEPVGFWDALDVAGITGYQELSRERHPTEEELVDGFRALRQRVGMWTRQSGTRFVFTEIGYPSQPFAARHPWDYRSRGDPDLQLQLRCYRALYRAWQAEPALEGLYVWNWFGVGGAGDNGYTPRGKPAADVLRHWYAAPPPATR